MSGSDLERKGLFRAVLGGPDKTMHAVFERLAKAEDSFPAIIDQRWNTRHVRVDLPAKEGDGCWRFISISDEVFAVITECQYNEPRFERVPAENMVEFHFVLKGPVELALPHDSDTETALTATTMMACHQAPGASYDVQCLPGAFRMISLYVRPQLLVDSYGFGEKETSSAARLLRPEPGSIVILEEKIDLGFVRVLRELFDLQFLERRDLMLAIAKIFELLALSTTALDNGAQIAPLMFSEKELQMFSQAREILTSDVRGNLTIAELARMLGTNSTKLKSGFKLLYGMTIFSFRNRYRMMRAMEMLIEQKQPISVVAHAAGYEHQASFTSAFKAHFGFAPKSARQMVRAQGKLANPEAADEPGQGRKRSSGPPKS